MHKGKFLYFLDLCVRKVNILEQVAVVTGMRSLKPCGSVSVAIPVATQD